MDWLVSSESVNRGEMAEWLKAHAWKACIRETVSGVRIPLSPPFDSAGGSLFVLSPARAV